MQAAGVTHLWLPPPSQSVAPQGYLPGQLYNLKSAYGTEESLRALNIKLMQAGIRPVADIVINHRCADNEINGVYNDYRCGLARVQESCLHGSRLQLGTGFSTDCSI